MDRKLFLFFATVVAVVILTGMSKLAISMLSFSVYCKKYIYAASSFFRFISFTSICNITTLKSPFNFRNMWLRQKSYEKTNEFFMAAGLQVYS